MLLHACCAPCSTVPIERLRQDFSITLYFYNPNIYPAEEYTLRCGEIEAFARKAEIPLILGEYETERWYDAIRGYEEEPEGGKRCVFCYSLRLEATAQQASASGIDAFCTTLTLSPHKQADVINRLGAEIGRRNGVRFHEENFKKKDGFLKSCRISDAEGLYRQDYCGCEFSRKERS